MEFDAKTRLFLNDVEMESFVDAVDNARLIYLRVVESRASTTQRLSPFNRDGCVSSFGCGIRRAGRRQMTTASGGNGGGDLGLTSGTERVGNADDGKSASTARDQFKHDRLLGTGRKNEFRQRLLLHDNRKFSVLVFRWIEFPSQR